MCQSELPHPIKIGLRCVCGVELCTKLQHSVSLKCERKIVLKHVSHVVRKPTFCICENKEADQLCGNREADQRLCFRYMDSTIPLLSKCEISSLSRSSVAVQPGLCRTWSETRTLVFSRRGSCVVSTIKINNSADPKYSVNGSNNIYLFS